MEIDTEHGRSGEGSFVPDRTGYFPGKQGTLRPYAGLHLIIDIRGGSNLDCIDTVEEALRRAVRACRATLLHIHLHKFSPQGVSGVAVLAESHISVHTWPELGYAAFDVFMCGDTDPGAAIEIFRDAFNADTVEVQELQRGKGLKV